MVFLSLGSNKGDRIDNILKACSHISGFARIVKKSSLFLTKPWGYPNQDDFINCVIEITTDLSAEELLKQIQKTEEKVGRTRSFEWGPREIDIDILLYDDIVIDSPKLKIPHRYLLSRDFFLEPLLEIAPETVNPLNGISLSSTSSGCASPKTSTIIKRIKNKKWNSLVT
ncbi:2-amino-4-hydroxy-6-hydroxymethyldihydropteridine diphosphokinase [bacterium]|nr:2-amino-4-hydroxy-6-hydroxymethyldihydropteridine diphosphokinase [bacterium]